MNEIMVSLNQVFSGLIPGVSGTLLLWILVTAIVVGIGVTLYYFKYSRTVSSGAKAIAKTLKSSVPDLLSSVSLVDATEGEFHYDHICLTPSGIVVVDIKDFRGLLFGGTNTDQWTQVIGSRSYKFENPLYHNREKIQTIKTLIDDEIPVYGCVIFTNAGSFPKDQPEGVFRHDKFEQEFEYAQNDKSVPPKYDEVWLKVKSEVNAVNT